MSRFRRTTSKHLTQQNVLSHLSNAESGPWPVGQDRQRLEWFPAGQRLIGLVRGRADCFVLPPAVVRKANWRE